MSRSIRLADRIGAVAGVLFALLIFISVASVDPVRGVSDQELQSWWADSGNLDGLVLSMYTLMLACPLFLVFVSRLRARLEMADTGGWSDLVFGFGIVATGALGTCAVLRGVIAGSMRFADEPLPAVDTLRFETDLSYALWDLVGLFIVVLVGTVSILALTTGALPRWLGALGAVVTIGSAVALAVHVAPFAIPLWIIWVIANCVTLLRAPAEARDRTTTFQADMSRAQA